MTKTGCSLAIHYLSTFELFALLDLCCLEAFMTNAVHIKTILKSEGVRTPKWKYMVFHEATPVYEELYDLEEDPDEANNLVASSDHQPILKELRREAR